MYEVNRQWLMLATRAHEDTQGIYLALETTRTNTDSHYLSLSRHFSFSPSSSTLSTPNTRNLLCDHELQCVPTHNRS